MSVCLSVCMWDIDIKNFTVSHLENNAYFRSRCRSQHVCTYLLTSLIAGKRVGLCGQSPSGGRRHRRLRPDEGGIKEEAHGQAGRGGEVHVGHLLQREFPPNDVGLKGCIRCKYLI